MRRIYYHLSKWLLAFYGPRMIHYKHNFQNESIKNLRIGNSTFLDYKEKLILHNNVYIGHHNFIESSNGIEIQEGCQLTSFITLTTHSSHHLIRLYGTHYGDVDMTIGSVKGSISIGRFTFVGPYSTIMPETKIGEGCIVSAYSYVKGNFPPYSIIAGNPAKVIGSIKDRDEQLLAEHPELKSFYMK